MGLKDVVNSEEYSSESQEEIIETDAEPDDIDLSEFDWKFVIAHKPWVAERIAYSRQNEEEEVKLLVKWIEELLDEGHQSLTLTRNIEQDLEETKHALEDML